jgi:hypothetical protein
VLEDTESNDGWLQIDVTMSRILLILGGISRSRKWLHVPSICVYMSRPQLGPGRIWILEVTLTYAHNTKSHTSALPHPSHTVNFTVATAKALSAQSVSRSKDNAHIAKSTASDNRKSETGSEGIVIPANDLPYRRFTKIRRSTGKESIIGLHDLVDFQSCDSKLYVAEMHVLNTLRLMSGDPCCSRKFGPRENEGIMFASV